VAKGIVPTTFNVHASYEQPACHFPVPASH